MSEKCITQNLYNTNIKYTSAIYVSHKYNLRQFQMHNNFNDV